MKFEYDEIHIRQGRGEKIYTFKDIEYYDFISMLDEIGKLSWELVGEIRGRIVVKRQY